MSGDIRIGGITVGPGQRRRLEIPVARLPTETWLSLPVEVLNGARPGPRLWLSAAVHGDELNGVEIISQVVARLDPGTLRGTLVAVPIVNVFGFINQSRYLPDRRDLNRSFPGSARGSLASGLAHLFMSEVVSQCTHGIDLHTGSQYRVNLPQIRANLQDPETRRFAEAFKPPVIIDARTRDGSLREAAAKRGIPVLLYEAGEPLRFDPQAIKLGVEGVFRVMAALRMCKRMVTKKRPPATQFAGTTWLRARRSGILHLEVELGQSVRKRQPLGSIADAFGGTSVFVRSPEDGVVIGHTTNPLVNRGDAVANLAVNPTNRQAASLSPLS